MRTYLESGYEMDLLIGKDKNLGWLNKILKLLKIKQGL